jgi:excisionase family DNA binding protein
MPAHADPRPPAVGAHATVEPDRDGSCGPAPARADTGLATASGTGSEATSTDRLPLRTPSQAAQLLAIPESWLRRKAAARAIPCTFLGKHLRFSPADLAAISVAGAQRTRTRTPTAGRRHRRTR